jgi:hypothetical protein
MARIMEELHSACVTPTVAPIQESSSQYKLTFKRGTYGQESTASQAAILTSIEYSNGKLLETNTPAGGKATTRTMLSNVEPGSGNKVFEYKNPTVQTEGFATPLSGPDAEKTILVRVAFKARPRTEPVHDNGAAAEIQDSATLRLTPPVYSSTKKALPCQ